MNLSISVLRTNRFACTSIVKHGSDAETVECWVPVRSMDVDIGDTVSFKNRDNCCYAASHVNWNTDRTGFQWDHIVVGDRFNPEIGFLHRSAFARTFGSARYSPRSTGWWNIRKVFYEASYDYYEDPNHGPESREAYGAMRMEFSNSDQWAFEFSRMFEKLNARLVPATGVTVPVGAYEFTQSRDL